MKKMIKSSLFLLIVSLFTMPTMSGFIGNRISKGSGRQEALIQAVQVGDKNTVKKMLKSRVDIDYVDKSGHTALDWAAELYVKSGKAKIYKKIMQELAKWQCPVAIESNLATVREAVRSRGRYLCIMGWTVVAPLTGLLGGVITCIAGKSWYDRKDYYPAPNLYKNINQNK